MELQSTWHLSDSGFFWQKVQRFQKLSVFQQSDQFSQLLRLFHHLDPTLLPLSLFLSTTLLHSLSNSLMGLFLLFLVGSSPGTPHPALAKCRAAEGKTAPPLLRGQICRVHSFVCEWKMGLYPAVCLNPLTRGKEKLSLLFSEADVWLRAWNTITEHLRYSAAREQSDGHWLQQVELYEAETQTF